MQRKIIVLDTETTGLNAASDEILQLSIIDGENNVLLDTYYKPERMKEWPEAEAVNKISPNDVKDKPCISEDREVIQNIIDAADLIVGYNVTFDLGFLNAAGINTKDKEHYDVMTAFAAIYGEWNYKRNCFKWQKLTKCAEYYNYDWSAKGIAAHNSLADCYATLYCYDKVVIYDNLIEKIESEYESFINKIKTYDVDEIINTAYEIAVKKEILFQVQEVASIVDFFITENQVETLLKAPNVLEACYNNWLTMDSNSFADDVRFCIKDEADRLAEINNKSM